MKKFIVIYYTPAAAKVEMSKMSKEDYGKSMQAWMAWKEKHGDKIVDLGAPLSPQQLVNKAGEWTASAKEVSGYSIVQAESAEAVKALFVDHPHLSYNPNCTIGVSEAVAIG